MEEGHADQSAVTEVGGRPPAPPCSICDYQGLELRVLNCQHSICQACLEEKINKIKSFPMLITCPQCYHAVILESEENLRLQKLAEAAAVEGRRKPQQPVHRETNLPRHKRKRKDKARRRQQEPKLDMTSFLDVFLLKVTLLNSLAILCFCILVYIFPSLRSPWLRSLEETYIVSVYEMVCFSPMLTTFLFLQKSISSVPSTCKDFRTCLPTLLALSAGLLGLVLTLLFFVFVTYAVVFLVQLIRKTGVRQSLYICSYLMMESMSEWMQGVDEVVR